MELQFKTGWEVLVDFENQKLKEYQAALEPLMECIQTMPKEAPILEDLRRDLDRMFDGVIETKIRLQNAIRGMLWERKHAKEG